MYLINDHIIEFYLQDKDSQQLQVSEWINYDAAFSDILQTTYDNGLATKDENGYYVEDENVYLFEDFERSILGLPKEYPFDMYIQTNGNVLTHNDFKYKINFYTFYPGGELLPYKINGPFLQINGKEYLLSNNQYQLYKAIEEFNTLPEEQRGNRNNFISFSQIKGLSEKAVAKLDSYLSDTNVCTPDKIKILVNYEEGTLDIIPNLDINDSEQFVERFNNKSDVKERYTIKEKEGKRTHVVFNHKQIEQLKRVKRLHHVTDKDVIAKITEYPDNYFDTDTIDISEFYSDRVIKIGLYQPKYYAFICPYKSEWIPGIRIEDNINGTANICFATKEELENFESKAKEAIDKGKASFKWNETEINAMNALQCASNAEKQFENPEYPDTSENKKNAHSTNGVLIIEENAEQLGYVVDIVEDKNEPEYTFYECSGLESGISLKDHQIEGIAWLQYLLLNNYRGCLLADDMGLGKTLQILYLLHWHKNVVNKSNKPYLIVAPVSLLDNWGKEYDKFFHSPKMSVQILSSNDFFKKELNQNDMDMLKSKNVILTNYETLRTYQLIFCAIDFSIVVLDEAQKAKTPGTLITNSVKALKSDFKIAVTGTPVENTLIDLWCIMDFSVPGLLGTAKDFGRIYQSPLNSPDANIELLGEGLRNKLGCYFKRRLKSEVAKDLPTKSIFKDKENMPPVQENRYMQEINAIMKIKESSLANKGFMFKAIAALRRISDSPYLVDGNVETVDNDELINNSAKMKITISLLVEIKNRNEKAIIFTDHKDTQRMLQIVVKKKFGINVHVVNGDTPATLKLNSLKLTRQQVIDRFQTKDGFNVIVMSPLAAGVGLNITGANNVIHYSRFWNPAKEEQATDRVYRIGQQKNVNVYYPMGISSIFMTFDVIIDNLLQKKSFLANATLFPTIRTEVKPQEIYEDLLLHQTDDNKIEKSENYLDYDAVKRLGNDAFTSLVFALYNKRGYSVTLSPKYNNKGINMVALKDDKGFSISCPTGKNVSMDDVHEILCGSEYYRMKNNIEIQTVIVCRQNLTHDAKTYAFSKKIMIIGEEKLRQLMEKFRINYSEIDYNLLT